jgi:hypothetical protein
VVVIRTRNINTQHLFCLVESPNKFHLVTSESFIESTWLAKFHVQVQDVDPDIIITIVVGGKGGHSLDVFYSVIYMCGLVFLGPTYRDDDHHHHHREVTNALVLTYTHIYIWRERERLMSLTGYYYVLITLSAEKNVFVRNSVFCAQFCNLAKLVIIHKKI